MKRTYKVGAHYIRHTAQAEMPGNLCGLSKWESKEVDTRTTNANNGQPYTFEQWLVVFFHEFFHCLDTMQGTELFGDNITAGKHDKAREVKLDSFCEAFVQFVLDNNMLSPIWVRSHKAMLKKVKPVEIGEKDDDL